MLQSKKVRAGLLAFGFVALTVGSNLLARFGPSDGAAQWLYWILVGGAYACLFVAFYVLVRAAQRGADQNPKDHGRDSPCLPAPGTSQHPPPPRMVCAVR